MVTKKFWPDWQVKEELVHCQLIKEAIETMSLSISVSVLSTKLFANQLLLAKGGGGIVPPPKFLVVQLTLFPPGGTLCPPHYYCPPYQIFLTAHCLCLNVWVYLSQGPLNTYIPLTSQNLTEGPYLKKK